MIPLMENLNYSDLFDSVRLSNLLRRSQAQGQADVPLARLYCHLTAGEIMKNLIFNNKLVLPENAVCDSGHLFAVACSSSKDQASLLNAFSDGKIRISCTAGSLKERLALIFRHASPDDHSGEFVLSGWPEIRQGMDVASLPEAVTDPQAVAGLPESLVEKIEFIHRLDNALLQQKTPFAKRFGPAVRMNELLDQFADHLHAFNPACGDIIQRTRRACADNNNVVNRSLCYKFLDSLVVAANGGSMQPPSLLGPDQKLNWSTQISHLADANQNSSFFNLHIEDARDVIDFAYNTVVSSDHKATNRSFSSNDLKKLAADAVGDKKKLGVAGVKILAPRSVSKYFQNGGEGLDWSTFFELLSATKGTTSLERAQNFSAAAGDLAALNFLERSPFLNFAVKLAGPAYRVVDAYHKSENDLSGVAEEVVGPGLETLDNEAIQYSETLGLVVRALFAIPKILKNADVGQTGTNQVLRAMATPLEQALLRDLLWNPSGT